MLKILELTNFRGFEEARLAGLSRFNVITGLNGSGKTSILEAAFLISGAANASLVASLYGFRGDHSYTLGSERPFRALFRNLDPGVLPKIVGATSTLQATTKKHRRELVIKPSFTVAQGQATTSQATTLRGITFEFSGPSGKAKSQWGWTDDAMKRPLQPSPVPKIILGGDPSENPDLVHAQFVSPYVRDVSPSAHELLTRLLTERRMDEVVDALKLISPSLQSLHPLVEKGESVIYADIGSKTLLPISLLGSGLFNCLHIVLPSVLHDRATILVDEFEDGIHHSLITPLLRIVLDLARVRNNQLFITTHSNEFLRYLINLAKGSESEDVSFFRLGRLGMKGVVPRYSVSEAEALLDSNMDIR